MRLLSRKLPLVVIAMLMIPLGGYRCNAAPGAPTSAGKSTKPASAPAKDGAADTKKSGKQIPIYRLEMTSNFAGPTEFLLSKDGVSARFVKMQLTMITRAPDWTGYLYNDSTHVYAALPHKSWTEHFMFRNAKKMKTKVKSVRDGKKLTIAGVVCSHLQINTVPADKSPPEVMAELWYAPNIKPTTEIATLLSTMLDVPITDGFPLRALHKQSNGRMVTVVDAYKVSTTTVPSSDFEPRPGYRKVRDEMSVMMDEGEEEMLGAGSGGSSKSEAGNALMKLKNKAEANK